MIAFKHTFKVFLIAYTLLNPSIGVAQDDGDKRLIGGRPAKPGELPIGVFISNCTGTLVGPETLLTAAHCRKTGQRIFFRHKAIDYAGTCTRHPRYNDNTVDNDFSLCKFSPKLVSTVYASLAPVAVAVGDKVTMQGYGRNQLGVLYVGESKVDRINGQDIQTNTKVHLGGGDSGGALFVYAKDLYKGPFIQIGINSRGATNGNRAYFNRVNLARTQKFFVDWAKANKVGICGINARC